MFFSLPRRGVSLARTRKRFPSAGVRSRSSPRVTGLLSFRGDVHFLLVHRRIARSRGERREGSARISSYPRARAHFRSCRVRLCVDCARGRNHESSSRERSFLLRFSLLLLSLRPPPPAPPLLSNGSNIDIDALLRRLRVFRAR